MDKSKDVQHRFSLRKVGKDLLSVSVGLLFAGSVGEKQMSQQVKASELPNHNQVSQIKSNQQVVAFGKIIPVNKNGQQIPNAPTPEYRRDPLNPNKAIATPVPKIKDYRLAKKNQTNNLDLETQMVYPPANPQEDTRIIYINSQVKRKNENKQSVVNHDNSQVPAVNNSSSSNSPSYQHEDNSAGYNNYSQSAENNGNISNPKSAPSTSSSSQLAMDNSVNNNYDHSSSDYSYNSSNRDDTFPQNSRTESANPQTEKKQNKSAKKEHVFSKRDIENKKKSKKNKKDHGNKPRSGRKNNRATMKLPEVIMNPETKLPPRPCKATLQVIDQDDHDKVMTSFYSEGLEGEVIEFDDFTTFTVLLRNAGFEIVETINDQTKKVIDLDAENPFGQYGQEDVDFTMNLKHKMLAISADNIPSSVSLSLVSKEVFLTVSYAGAGDENPKENIQKAIWTRTLTMDEVTHQLVDDGKFNTPWVAHPLAYDAVETPEIDGYEADITEVEKIPVTQDDIVKTVHYLPVEQEDEEVAKEVEPEETEVEEKPSSEAEKAESNRPAKPSIGDIEKQAAILLEKLSDMRMKRVEISDKDSESESEDEKQASEIDSKSETESEQPESLSSEAKETEKVEPATNSEENSESDPEPISEGESTKSTANKDQEIIEGSAAQENQLEDPESEPKPSVKEVEEKDSKPVEETSKIEKAKEKEAPKTKRVKNSKKNKRKKQKRKANKKIRLLANPKFGAIIPVDVYGNLITDPRDPSKAIKPQHFLIDPEDSRRPLAEQEVPQIPGWVSTQDTVSPANPLIDIPVVYHKVEE